MDSGVGCVKRRQTAEEQMTFYDLSEEERVALTQKAIGEHRTVIERWSTLKAAEAAPWKARAAVAAALLISPKSVLDLGCGLMSLEEFLSPDTAYQPVDVVSRDNRTIVCDFNKSPPPRKMPEAVTCLGLREYLFEPASLLNTLSWRHKAAVISYCATDAPEPIEDRRANAWVNDMSVAQIEAMFQATGWRIVHMEPLDKLQFIWRLEADESRKSKLKAAFFELSLILKHAFG